MFQQRLGKLIQVKWLLWVERSLQKTCMLFAKARASVAPQLCGYPSYFRRLFERSDAGVQ